MTHRIAACALAALVTIGLATVAVALPQTQTAIDTNIEATLTLTTWDQVIIDDARTRCEIRIVVAGEEVRFSEGDSVVVHVYENDVLFDDVLWQDDFVITAEELAAQRVDRMLDCSSAIPTDIGSDGEIYAEASVEKSLCGFFCNGSDPATDTIPVREVEDDEAEEDDHAGTATFISPGIVEDRINREQDWFEFSLNDRGNVTFAAVHDGRYGRLDVALFDDQDERIAEGDDEPEQTVVRATGLAMGTYRVRISPRQSNDFNFYDTRLVTERFDDGCEPAAEDVRPCGDCGSQIRVCQNDGQWGLFGDCEDQGECTPGDERRIACNDMCGVFVDTCADTCGWERDDECVGSGECTRGTTQTRECDGGVEFRTCTDQCGWAEWSACSERECEEEAVRTCYDGPEGSAGVGICREGRQRCIEGLWEACGAQIIPVTEQCTDGRDNDCDGNLDGEDPECQSDGAEIGSACADTPECSGDLLCLQPPQNEQFVDGYCGDDDCDDDDECGDDGVCTKVFGQNYCLRVCEDIGDCRRGYLCAAVDGGQKVCLPRCTGDEACTDADLPTCDAVTGLCIPDGGANNGANNGGNNGGNNGQNNGGNNGVNNGGNNGANNGADAGNNGADTGTPPNDSGGSDDGCGCNTASPSAVSLWRRR
jgi:hypothetical protein